MEKRKNGLPSPFARDVPRRIGSIASGTALQLTVGCYVAVYSEPRLLLRCWTLWLKQSKIKLTKNTIDFEATNLNEKYCNTEMRGHNPESSRDNSLGELYLFTAAHAVPRIPN